MSTEIRSTAVVIDEQNPWPGLKEFDEAAQDYFTGRNDETAELLRLVGQAPLTVLFGKSGLGKTSLLQAGLFPRLRKLNFLPVYVRLVMRDRSAPLIQQVANALQTEIVKHCSADSIVSNDDKTLWQYLHGRNSQWWSPKNQPLTPLFVIDQFEEAFTLGAENAEAIERLRLDLADLIENRIPTELAKSIEEGALAEHLDLRGQHYKVLMSFREDFLPEVEGWKGELPSFMRNRLRLLPMSADHALQVVCGITPNERTHKLVNNDAGQEIVRFVAAVQSEDEKHHQSLSFFKSVDLSWEMLEIEPALLSLVCEGLNEKRKSKSQTTIEADLLKETGKTIIADFYKRCVAGVPNETREFIQDCLITEGGFRNSYPLQEALDKGWLTEPLLLQLVECRLLRVEHLLRTERVELIHDRLTDVVRESRDLERMRKLKLEEQKERELEEQRRRELEAEKEKKRKFRFRVAVISAFAALVLAGVFLKLYIKAKTALETSDREKNLRISKESELQQTTATLERNKALEKTDSDRKRALNLGTSGNYTGALELLATALTAYKSQQENQKTAITLVDIGKLHALKKQYDLAKKNYSEALGIAKRTKSDAIEGAVLENIASLSEQEGHIPESLALYKHAYEKYKSGGEVVSCGRIMELLADYAESIRDYNTAESNYRKALSSYDSGIDKIGLKRVEKAIARTIPWGFIINIKTAEVYKLRGHNVAIGRNTPTNGSTNDISFANRFVSRKHLAINYVYHGNYQLEDLRSMNTTTLNGKILPYGRGFKLSDGDIISLANMEVLQFMISKPLPNVPPPSAWGMFINEEKKSYQYLTGSEYSVVMKTGKLSLEQGVSEAAVLKLRYVDKKAQMYEVKDEWNLVFTWKESDYDYGKRELLSGEWVELLNLPFTYIRSGSDKQEILSEGPSFQIISMEEDVGY